jgi:PAS domain S-box-containing protein
MTAGSTASDEAEARYRALFETMGPAVLLMRGPACVDCNPATLALFGVERREDILGKTPLDFAPEIQPCGTPSVELVQRNIVDALAHGSCTFEWQSRRANGEPFLMEVRFTPCGPPEDQLFLCIAVDISERRRVDDGLRASEARFRAIVERAAEGILVVDAETRQLRYANPEICRLLGFGSEELVGRDTMELHPPEVMAEVREAFGRQAAGGVHDTNLLMRRKDGSVVEVFVRGANVELDGRRCVLGLFTDQTERRQIEAERVRTQKLEALGVLAGGIAHDFNNLLQAIFGYVSVAKSVDDLAAARAALAESEAALSMATRLTSQLLTFSRGGTPLRKAVEAAPIVERAAKLALAGSSLRCDFDFGEALPDVDADEGQLEQVVQNIVLNAAQAMPQGGTIRVVLAAVELPLPGAPPLPPGRYVTLGVHDTGVGIPESLIARIWDPYFTTKQRGSGLGLATVYSIVKNHGGAVTVQSRQGEGSAFTVFLPACAVAAKTHSDPPRSSTAESLRVLLMDDDTLVRNVTQRLLELLGHSVDSAADGEAAIVRYEAARATGEPYDLVILDLTVPAGLGGKETLARLRAVDPGVRAVVSSGYSDDESLGQYSEHGFHAVLRKPYVVEELAAALAMARQ